MHPISEKDYAQLTLSAKCATSQFGLLGLNIFYFIYMKRDWAKHILPCLDE